ncbi:MAG: A24 family peptidase [Anaerolineales bacterium]
MTPLFSALLSNGLRLALSVTLLMLAAYDLHHKRVPNVVIRPGLVLAWSALAARLALGQVSWEQFGVAALTSAVCLALWWMRAFGGGDMKLTIALAALFPDVQFVYLMLATVLLGSILALIVWDGRTGWRRLVALFVTAGHGALPSRSDVSAAYQARGRPITFAFSLSAILYLWLVWPGWS